MTRTQEQYERHLADNRRPHPVHVPKRVEIACLGHACGHKKFWSAGRRVERLCPHCRAKSDAVVGGSAGHRVPAKGRTF